MDVGYPGKRSEERPRGQAGGRGRPGPQHRLRGMAKIPAAWCGRHTLFPGVCRPRKAQELGRDLLLPPAAASGIAKALTFLKGDGGGEGGGK